MTAILAEPLCVKLIVAQLCHMALTNQALIGSDNGLLPVQPQAITETNAHLLVIGPSWTNISEIWIKVHKFHVWKMHLIMISAKSQPFQSQWASKNLVCNSDHVFFKSEVTK